MFMLLVSVAIFVGLLLVLKKTRVGLIVQAALTHPHMVGHLGHNVPTVFMLVFGVGAGARRARRRDRRARAGDAVEHGGAARARSCSWSWWSAGSARCPAPSSPRC